MKRTAKILLSLLGGVMGVCCALGFSACQNVFLQDWVFELSDDGTYYTIAGYTGSDSNILIPASYQKKPVKSIGEEAFSNCLSLKKVDIPDSVTSIGDYAFSGCRSLTSVVIPDSVTSIGEYAFNYCRSLTSVVIGDSVTSIGNYAFEDCSSLTSVTIPNSVTSIGKYTFYNCSSLTSIKYRGTQAQWNAISKGSYWNKYTGSYIITYNY